MKKYCKWKYEDLPILPQPWQFIVPDEKKQQFEIVRALLNRSDVDSVTAATDAGREGELIFRFVYQMAGCTKPVKRLWISSMEDAAYPGGLRKPAPGFGLQCAIPIGPLPRKGRLAGGHQCNAAVFGAVPQDPDGGSGADPDTKKCWWTGMQKNSALPKRKSITRSASSLAA